MDPSLEALGTAQKDWKLLRGGSWFNGPHDCRAAYRFSRHLVGVFTNDGVRPCCLLPPGSLLGPCALGPLALPLRGSLAARAVWFCPGCWVSGFLAVLLEVQAPQAPGIFIGPANQAGPSQMGITPLAWMARSWVASGIPWVSAVATINRSAGSPWKLCGK